MYSKIQSLTFKSNHRWNVAAKPGIRRPLCRTFRNYDSIGILTSERIFHFGFKAGTAYAPEKEHISKDCSNLLAEIKKAST